MTQTALPGAPAPPPGPAPVALAVARDLVTTHRLRLVDPHDSRLGWLAGEYELGAGSFAGVRAAYVGFFRPPADAAVAEKDLARRCEAARRWGRQRLADQKVERCDILLIALAPVGGRLVAREDDPAVRVGVASIDVAGGNADEVLPIPRGLPSAGDLRRQARRVRDGAEVPTLAAVDLAERQTVAGGYVQPTRQALVTAPVVTYSFIGIFIAIYLAEKALISPSPLVPTPTVTLANFGALINFNFPSSPLFAAPSWWRYVSSAFLHDDRQIFHVLGNSLAMFFIGRLVEQLYGRIILIGTFLFTAIVGGLVWVAAGAIGLTQVPGLSIGASGGISGLMGLLILLGRFQGRDVPAGVAAATRQYVATYVVLNLLFGLFLTSVNNYAHAGGFVAGMLLSIVLAPAASVGGRPLRRHEQVGLLAVMGVSAVALGFAGYHLVSDVAHPTVVGALR